MSEERCSFLKKIPAEVSLSKTSHPFVDVSGSTSFLLDVVKWKPKCYFLTICVSWVIKIMHIYLGYVLSSITLAVFTRTCMQPSERRKCFPDDFFITITDLGWFSSIVHEKAWLFKEAGRVCQWTSPLLVLPLEQ